MKVVIAGPFGCGMLADEAVLAGLLRHLSQKHEIIVLSQDPDKTEALHDVEIERLARPKDLLSTPAAWRALSQAHLFIICGGGVLSERGGVPARAWLGLLEHAHRVEVETAVVGVGALPVEDRQERIRLQRLLHNFTAGISVRDEQTKQILAGYGLSPARISANGDLTLALAAGAPTGWSAASRRIGLIFSEHIPSREGFGADERQATSNLLQATRNWLVALLAKFPHELVIFHEDTFAAAAAATEIRDGAPAARVHMQPANLAPAMLQKELAGCAICFSFSLHGLILSATCGVPVVGLAAETGASQFLGALGLGANVVASRQEAFDAEAALQAVRGLLERAPEIHAQVTQKIAVLARKEAQNARMLECLVPKRDRYPARKKKDKGEKGKHEEIEQGVDENSED